MRRHALRHSGTSSKDTSSELSGDTLHAHLDATLYARFHMLLERLLLRIGLLRFLRRVHAVQLFVRRDDLFSRKADISARST